MRRIPFARTKKHGVETMFHRFSRFGVSHHGKVEFEGDAPSEIYVIATFTMQFAC